MALSYPLAQSEFFLNLPIMHQTCWLPDQMELNRTGSGEQLAADLGNRLWQGDIKLGKMTRAQAGQHEVLIDLLNQAGRSFLMHDTRRPFPLLDPTGSILGAATPTVLAFGPDVRELRLTGLPANYALSAGDYIGFTYLTGPTRFACHRLVAPITANGSGVTALFEVTPEVRTGASAGVAVTLIRPRIKALIVPGSVRPATTRHTISEGLSFSFVQTLRS
jgi:hypothetical protein